MSKPRLSRKLAKMQIAGHSWANELVTSILTMAKSAQHNRKTCNYLAMLVKDSQQILEVYPLFRIEGNDTYSDYCVALQAIEGFVREVGVDGRLMGRLRSSWMLKQQATKLQRKLCTAIDGFQLNVKLAHENTIKQIHKYLYETSSQLSHSKSLPDIDEALWYHTHQRYKEALQRFQQHSSLGNIIAKFFLGYYFLTGEYGVAKNENLALSYLCAAADRGVVPAQFWYAHACVSGSIYEPERATIYLREAAKKQDPYAVFWYADMLLKGECGVEKNLVESERLFRIAMNKGHPLASFKINCLSGRKTDRARSFVLD